MLALSTPDGQACLRKVTLSLKLHGLARQVKEMGQTHRIVVYADTCAHPLLVRHVELAIDEQVEATFEFQVVPREPRILIARWFGLVKKEGCWAQECIASASTAVDTICSKPGHYEMGLIDIAHVRVATLTIAGVPWQLPPCKLDHTAGVELGRRVLAAYDQLSAHEHMPEHRFATVDVHLDRVVAVPAVWFTLHAMQLKFEKSVATDYFARCIAIAKPMLHPNHQSQHQLLADVLALPSLGWIYRQDDSYQGKTIDTWSTLWNYPPGAPCAYDCEDGSKALLEMVIALQRLADMDDDGDEDEECRGQQSEVLHLARLACRYTGWLVIGELRRSDDTHATASNNPFITHCYVVLEPMVSSDPFITLESTSWSSGAWWPTRTAELESDTKLYRVAKQVMAALPEQEQSQARIRIPISLVRRSRMYGRITAMISSRVLNAAGSMSTQHKLMRSVEANDYLMRRVQPCAIMAINQTNQSLKQTMANQLALAPVCLFPVAVATGSSRACMVVMPASCAAKPYPVAALTGPIQLAVVDHSVCAE